MTPAQVSAKSIAANHVRRNGQPEFALIRYAHIFAAAVRESLELNLLRAASLGSLSLPQFHLLTLISINGQHQVGEVADFLGVTPPAATKTIDKLERLGLVERVSSTVDRRVKLISATARGRQLVERYDALKEERLRTVIEGFAPEELSQLTRLLERFALGLVASDGQRQGLCLRCSAYFDDHCPVQHLHDGCPYQQIMADRSRLQAATT